MTGSTVLFDLVAFSCFRSFGVVAVAVVVDWVESKVSSVDASLPVEECTGTGEIEFDRVGLFEWVLLDVDGVVAHSNNVVKLFVVSKFELERERMVQSSYCTAHRWYTQVETSVEDPVRFNPCTQVVVLTGKCMV